MNGILIHSFNSFIFFNSLNIVLIKMVPTLMMSANIATLGVLKMKVFLSKNYDVIIFVNSVSSKILSCDSNYILDVVT